MPNRDDDDDELELFARPEDVYLSLDDRKAKQRERMLKSKGELQDLKREVLLGKIRKQQGQKEKKQEQKPPETFGTKTHKQAEEQAVLNIGKKQGPDWLIEEAKRQEAKEGHAEQEYQSEPG